MDEIKWAVAARPADLLELRAKLVAGDGAGARRYVLAAAWQRIKVVDGFTMRQRVRVLRELASKIKVGVEWQTPTAA